MHIAFVSLGAFGHINPTLALVTELVKKGVRVTYFTTEAFRTIIEPTGAKFVAVPSWMAENDKHNEDGEKKEDDGGVAAAVPLPVLKRGRSLHRHCAGHPEKRQTRRCRPRLCGHCRHNRGGQPQGCQRHALHQLPLQRQLLGSRRVRELPAGPPSAQSRGAVGPDLCRKIWLPPADRQGNLRRPRGLQPGHDAEKVGSQLRDFR